MRTRALFAERGTVGAAIFGRGDDVTPTRGVQPITARARRPIAERGHDAITWTLVIARALGRRFRFEIFANFFRQNFLLFLLLARHISYLHPVHDAPLARIARVPPRARRPIPHQPRHHVTMLFADFVTRPLIGRLRYFATVEVQRFVANHVKAADGAMLNTARATVPALTSSPFTCKYANIHPF